MSSYRTLILEVTACDPADALPIEDVMRIANGGVLDHLDRRRFRREARRARSMTTRASCFHREISAIAVILQGTLKTSATAGGPFVLEGAGLQVQLKTPKPGPVEATRKDGGES